MKKTTKKKQRWNSKNTKSLFFPIRFFFFLAFFLSSFSVFFFFFSFLLLLLPIAVVLSGKSSFVEKYSTHFCFLSSFVYQKMYTHTEHLNKVSIIFLTPSRAASSPPPTPSYKILPNPYSQRNSIILLYAMLWYGKAHAIQHKNARALCMYRSFLYSLFFSLCCYNKCARDEKEYCEELNQRGYI